MLIQSFGAGVQGIQTEDPELEAQPQTGRTISGFREIVGPEGFGVKDSSLHASCILVYLIYGRTYGRLRCLLARLLKMFKDGLP